MTVLPKLRTRLTFANVVSVLALFVALGGSSYAALTVTGKTVQNSSLTGKDVKNSSLSTKDVKNRSLLARDFKARQLPAGKTGPQGPAGQRGAAGQNGAQGKQGVPGEPGLAGATNVVVREATGSVPGEDNGLAGTLTLVSPCLTGERATGGSADAGAFGRFVVYDRPIPNTEGAVPTGWEARFGNDTPGDRPVSVYAVCASP